jgi:hypothetical protein
VQQVADQSAWLATPADGGQGYWASYNRAFFPDLFELSDAPAVVANYTALYGADVGAYFTWGNYSRANIFRRDAPGVATLADMQRIMRYNDYENDPLSTQGMIGWPPSSPINAISARGDLAPLNGTYVLPDLMPYAGGSVDGKITAWSLMVRTSPQAYSFGALAQVGPTYDQQPPFVWSTSEFANVSHVGHPDEFQFPWVSLTAP